MRLLAALASGATGYLLVGFLTGHTPKPLRRVRVRSNTFQTWLLQAGTGVTPVQFIGVSLGAALATFLVVWALAGAAPVALVPAIAVGTLPRGWFARQREQRKRERLAAWPDALRDLVSKLEASTPLHPALVSLATTGPEPLRPVWQRYRSLSSALEHRAALEAIRREMADPVSDRIIEVLLVAHEQGTGVVLDLLRDLAETTTDDLRLLETIETAQLEHRIEARVVAILPFVVLVMLTSRSDDYRDFYSTPLGVVVIIVGAVLTLIGTLVIQRLGRMREETRVLIGPGAPT